MRYSSSPKRSRVQTVASCLGQSHDWARVAAHAQQLLRLQQIYVQIVPEHLARSSRVANYKLGKVVIHAANGAVAAKLKQMVHRLADDFCKKGCEVTGVTIRVQVAAHHDNEPRLVPARSISGAARARIEQAAAELGDDSPLKASLLRLARHSR